MKSVYAFDSVESARAAVTKLRAAGVSEDRLSLVARSDIQLEKVPDDMLDPSMDFAAAASRGAAVGAATGLFAGLLMMIVPPLGIAVGGPALIALVAGGTFVGAWSSALMGAAIPDKIRRTFDDEIAAGRVLLAIDAASESGVERKVLGQITDGHLLWQGQANPQPRT